MARDTTHLSIYLLFIAFKLFLILHFLYILASPAVYMDSNDHEHLLTQNMYLQNDEPEFVGQVPNITVSVGRDAKFPCIVDKLDTYRVSTV